MKYVLPLAMIAMAVPALAKEPPVTAWNGYMLTIRASLPDGFRGPGAPDDVEAKASAVCASAGKKAELQDYVRDGQYHQLFTYICL